jgi:hypothetical protein
MTPPLIPLGYGVWVRADRIFALVPLGPGQRGERRRTLVHVDGLGEPLVASRSERAILADLDRALDHPGERLPPRRPPGQGELW